jgi:hypothetical protein
MTSNQRPQIEENKKKLIPTYKSGVKQIAQHEQLNYRC